MTTHRWRSVIITLGVVVIIAGGVLWWWHRPDAGETLPSPTAATQTPPVTPGAVPVDPPTMAIADPLPTTIAPEWQHTFDRLAYGTRWDGAQPPELAAFRDWSARYAVAATATERAALEAEGVALAMARRPVFLRLIESDPEHALELTVPANVRAAMPPAVTAQLEARVGGVGTFAAVPEEPSVETAETGDGGHDHVEEHFVRLGGASYVAHAYGRRRVHLTEESASLHGVALDGHLAVHASPLRVLDVGERPTGPLEVVDPASGEPRADAATTVANVAAPLLVEFHGRWWALADPASLGRLERSLRALETLPGPVVPPFTPGILVEPPTANAAPTNWTTGTKRLLVVRVDFPDVIGEPVNPLTNAAISQSYAQGVVNNDVQPFYVEASYGETTLDVTVTNRVYRMPKTAATYAQAYDLMGLYDDAVAAARANHNPDNFDLVQLVFSYLGPSRIPGSKFGFAGVAFRGGKQSFINGYYIFDVVAHELGHCYGLAHANLWRSYGNPIADYGTTQEYGDTFDIMGGYGGLLDRRHHFNPWFKNELGWLPDGAVTFAATSGTYRVYRFDAQDAVRTQPLALNVFRDGCRSYWLGNRRTIAGAIATSAYVQWGFYSNQQSQLLDIGATTSDLGDAGLAVGSALDDSLNGVTLRTVASGGTSPSEYLDIEVTVQPPARNLVAHWGEDDAVHVPPGLRDIVAIAAGDEHGLALKRSGELVTWGETNSEGPNRFGELNIPWQPFNNLASFTAGGDSSGFVLKDGTAYVWGIADFGQNTIPPGLNNVKQLALGGDHALALKNDGTVVAWGSNAKGQISVPAGLTGVKALSAGRDMTLALLDNGTVLHWGINAAQLPNNLANVVAVAAGWGHGLALRSDGTVVAWGDNSDGQATVPAGLNNVKQIGAGHLHSVALKNDGTVVAWGNNDLLQVTIPRGLPKIDTIAVAENHVMGLIPGTNQPFFLREPADQTVQAGAGVYFSVEVDGAPPLTYRWQRQSAGSGTWSDVQNGLFSGAETAQLYLLDPAVGMSGDRFRCIVNTGAGTTLTSRAATLTVQMPAIFIYANPQNASVQSGQNARFTILTNADRHFTFRWQGRSDSAAEWTDLVNDELYRGVATSGLDLVGVSSSLNGSQYRCVVSNGGQQPDAVSAAASLTVLPRNLAILRGPADRTVELGSNAEFSVEAVGEGVLTYQWERRPAGADTWTALADGAGIVGARAAMLVVRAVGAALDGVAFRCVVDDPLHDPLTSAPARLTVTAPAPTMATYPLAHAPTTGGRATLTFAGASPAGATWQWRRNGRDLPGATAASLVLDPLTGAETGYYDVVITEIGGATTVSGVRWLEVLPASYPNASRMVESFRPRFERGDRGDRGSQVRKLLPASDGGMYVAGFFGVVDGAPRSSLFRLRADGSLDAGFRPALPDDGTIRALALQSDGRLLVGATTFAGAVAEFPTLVRLTNSGAIDPTFASGGGPAGSITALLVLPDDRILVSGEFSEIDGVARQSLALLNADGSLDSSFDAGEVFPHAPRAMDRQLDGKLIVAGGFGGYMPNGGRWIENVQRLLPNGQVDLSFAPTLGSMGFVSGVKVLPDGKILAGISVGGSPIMRLNTDGSRDFSFVPDSSVYARVFSLTVQGDKLLVTSGAELQPSYRVSLLSLDGTPVASFSDFGNSNWQMYDAQFSAGGTIYVGGEGGPIFGVPGPSRLFRLSSSLVWDAAWSPSLRFPGEVRTLVAVDAGKWVVGGAFTHVNGVPRLGLARLDANGEVDTAFGTDDAGFGRWVDAVALLPDGRLMVGGTFTGYTGFARRFLARVDQNGVYDEGFAPNIAFLGGGLEFGVRCFAVQSDRQVLVGGAFSHSPGPSFSWNLGRVNGADQFDPELQASGSFAGFVDALLVREGRVWLGGTLSSPVLPYPQGLVRLYGDGALDPAFQSGVGFRKVENLPPITVSALAVDSSGRIIAGGRFETYNGIPRRNLARLDPGGALDPFFATGAGFNDRVHVIKVQADGRILVGGAFTEFDGTAVPCIVRLGSDGARDASFSVAGLRARPGDVVRAISCTPTGRIVLGGTWLDFGSSTGGGLIMLEPAGTPPAVLAAPQPQTATAGQPVTLTASAPDELAPTFQWQFNGVNIPGATAAGLTVTNTQHFHSGVYTVVVGNAHGSTISGGVDLNVVEPPSSNARLTNLSTRAVALTGDNVLIPGFVVTGPGNKQLLIRAVGPTLGDLGVAGTLPDPRLVLKRWNGAAYDDVATNDNWGTNTNAADIIAKSADLFAFPLAAGSVDAALLVDLAPGQYSAVAGDAGTQTGIAIVELYDADANGGTARLINISNRGFVGVGDSNMIPGFVVSDEGPKTLLIRAVGPTLSVFGVSGVLADPTLTIFRRVNNTEEEILTNDDWSVGPGASRTRDVVAQVQAFALPEGSNDAAFVVTLNPGIYTVHARGVNGTTGVALVEVYAVP